jgi:DNA-binding SARP family transcriptional activator/predicted negative regulator of RcsB-dependent stress response
VEIRGASPEPDAEPLAQIQPKRTALLAFLAMAGGTVRRDTLRALLWPELDDGQARRALNQAVFHLRRAIGNDAIESVGMESLTLRAELVSCDAVEFEEHCRAGRLDQAMALYRGPFLGGFHVGSLEELERWVDTTRARLASAAVAACSTLASDRASSDPQSALTWARRAYELDPGDAAIRRVIMLHDALGDRAGAIREYEQFARRMSQELDIEPSPETRQLADDIRARAEPLAGTPVSVPVVALVPAVPANPAGTSAPAASVRPRAQRKMPAKFLIVAALIVAATVVGWTLTRSASPSDAGLLTNSREALDAYRAGEKELDAGRFESAVDDFRRAVVADSDYAMAQYRLSVAANWTGQTVLSNSAAQHAEHLATTLPGRDRSRIEAWVHYLRGETDEAQREYTSLLAADPTDFDAAFYLAEIQFHWGPSFGTPADASAPAWDRVLQLQPDNAGAIIHRMRIAASEFDSASFESLSEHLLRLDPSPDHQIEVRALRAFSFGDSASQAASSAEIASVDALRHSLVHETLLYARDMRSASLQLIPTLFIGQNFSSWEQGEFLLGAQASAATGNVTGALATIDSAALLDPNRALEYRAMIASVPGLTIPAGLRASVRRQLDLPSASYKYITQPLMRDYFRSLLALRDGDLPAAHRALAALLSRAPRPGPGFDTTIARHIDRLSRIDGAEIALAEGKPDSALAILGTPAVEPDRRIPYVWSYPRAEERLLRGDLLAKVGRKKEALAWYSTFPDPGAYDLAYLPAALARRATIAAEIGDTASANWARMRLAELK